MHPMKTWCLVGVVVPIGAVQKGCREDEQRVVVPLADTPQKRYGRPSPEQVNSMKHACRRWNGENTVLREMWFFSGAH
jgi:hypothetical protein